MKEPSKFYDPCEESRMASMDCLYRNQDDKYACQEFFDAYRECRKDFLEKETRHYRWSQRMGSVNGTDCNSNVFSTCIYRYVYL